ncbi:hypothetical protein ACIPYS_26720 [Kitasatospora sp. NPDC089913]|uniref:hypothetical protein n=1 Tax=Streptomycetaceae TaxID=2062 RepID=UPI00087DC199|nr:hypothetical protein [Streptomyces sp. TLI_053]SDT83049.1 hypothetical protein SAMN05216371_7862 [Streptomyces sp. TLI_053]
MDGTSGAAREELDRLGRSLRDQMVVLITGLTVRVHLRRLSVGEPKVADERDPSRYHCSAMYQGDRPARSTAAGTASRAVDLLRAAGWEVAVSEEDDDGRLWTVVAAHRDGSTVRVLTSDDTPAVVFRGWTPALVLRPSQPAGSPEPEPERTPGTVTPGYVLCYECDGLGRCPGCGGRGWVPRTSDGSDRRKRCGECATRRVCPICRGAGQLAVHDLSTYQRGYYPDLAQD